MILGRGRKSEVTAGGKRLQTAWSRAVGNRGTHVVL